MNESSPSLLRRIAEGDESAVSETMSTYGGLIWSMARGAISNRVEAEEVVQDIFVDLWQSASRFDPAVASEKTFIAMIARRRIIDLIRKRSRSKEFATEHIPVQVDAASDAPARPEVSDETRRVAEAMNALRPEQKQVLTLSLVRGLTHDQIAGVTDMPLGTVKTHARRGLIRVKELLESSEERSVGPMGVQA